MTEEHLCNKCGKIIEDKPNLVMKEFRFSSRREDSAKGNKTEIFVFFCDECYSKAKK